MEGKKQREEVKKLFVSNWGLKLISLLIAFGLWFTVVYIKDPLEEETFVNIHKTNPFVWHFCKFFLDRDKYISICISTSFLHIRNTH